MDTYKLTIEPCNKNHEKETHETCEHVFQSKDDINRSITRVCYGNPYVIGTIWIETMKTVLAETEISLIPIMPVVAAATKEEPPKKPPRMKYKDLSTYKSPHYDYKEYLEDKTKCSGYKNKILFSTLLPQVKSTRKDAENEIKEYSCLLKCKCKKACCALNKSKDDFLCNMRHPDNIALGRGLVITAGVLGFVVGKRLSRYKNSLLRGLFVSGLSVLAVGAVFFPKETDENFREFCYHSAKSAIRGYNGFCNKNFMFREKLPCVRDLPEKPPPRKEQCPVKK